MKYVFLSMIIFIIGCSSPSTQTKESKEEITDPSLTMMFEGKEYLKVDVERYQREDDHYQTILTLFPNGNVESVEHQGDFQSCGTIVDTSRYFNEDGALIKQVYHDHWMPEGAIGCHESIQDQHITEYFDDGSIKAKKVYRLGYQDTEHKAGTWQEFDENGNILSTINYGDPYSAEEVLKIEFIEKLNANFGDPHNRLILSRKGFSAVPRKSHEEGVMEFYNAKHDSRIVLSKDKHFGGGSVFSVNYSVNRNQLVAFEKAIKNMKGTYTYHGFAADAYFKEGLGTYRTKKVVVKVEEGLIVYTYVEGKETQLPPVNFTPIDSLQR